MKKRLLLIAGSLAPLSICVVASSCGKTSDKDVLEKTQVAASVKNVSDLSTITIDDVNKDNVVLKLSEQGVEYKIKDVRKDSANDKVIIMYTLSKGKETKDGKVELSGFKKGIDLSKVKVTAVIEGLSDYSTIAAKDVDQSKITLTTDNPEVKVAKTTVDVNDDDGKLVVHYTLTAGSKTKDDSVEISGFKVSKITIAYAQLTTDVKPDGEEISKNGKVVGSYSTSAEYDSLDLFAKDLKITLGAGITEFKKEDFSEKNGVTQLFFNSYDGIRFFGKSTGKPWDGKQILILDKEPIKQWVSFAQAADPIYVDRGGNKKPSGFIKVATLEPKKIVLEFRIYTSPSKEGNKIISAHVYTMTIALPA